MDWLHLSVISFPLLRTHFFWSTCETEIIKQTFICKTLKVSLSSTSALRSVGGRSVDQRQVGHVLLVLHTGPACSCNHGGRSRAGHRGQTLKPKPTSRLSLTVSLVLWSSGYSEARGSAEWELLLWRMWAGKWSSWLSRSFKSEP